MTQRQTVSVVLRIKDEGPYILDWVAHHVQLGFDRIIIVSHDLTDGSDLLLRALHDIGVIHWQDFTEDLAALADTPHRGHFANSYAYKVALSDDLICDWLYVADADEFLAMNEKVDVGEWLARFVDTDQVMLAWMNLVPTESGQILGQADPGHDGEWHGKTVSTIKSFTRIHASKSANPHRMIEADNIARVSLADGVKPNADILGALKQHLETRKPPGIAKILEGDWDHWLRGAEHAFMLHFKYRSIEEYIYSKILRGDFANNFLRNSIPDYIQRIRHIEKFPVVDTSRYIGADHQACKSELLANPGVRDAQDRIMRNFWARIEDVRRDHPAYRMYQDYMQNKGGMFDMIASAKRCLEDSPANLRSDAALQLVCACQEKFRFDEGLEALFVRGDLRGSLQGDEVDYFRQCVRKRKNTDPATVEAVETLVAGASKRYGEQYRGKQFVDRRFLGADDLRDIRATLEGTAV